MADGGGVVAGEGAEAVLIGMDHRRHAAQVLGEVLDAGTVDQRLPLHDPAEQQADDEQHDRDLDEGESGLRFLLHGLSPG